MDETEGKAILSMDAFEHHKENVVPVKAGRSAAVLANMLNKGDIEHQRAALEADLLVACTLDPLDPYHRYLKFLEQHYPSGHPDFGLVLEATVRKFKRDERYKNDPRYLWMWLRVARQAQDPVQVFKYLSVNEIGGELAAYYEEYAQLMVAMKRFDEAGEILLLGIHRSARPLERLKARYEGFKNLPRPIVEPEQEPVPPVSTSTRPVLAARRGGTTALSAPSQTSKSTTSTLQVYRDSEGQHQALSERVMPTSTQANPWPDYGTSMSQRKENVREPTRWTGAILPQKKARQVPTRSKIEVYQDEPSESDIPPVGPVERVLRPKDVKASGEPSTASVLMAMDRSPPKRDTISASEREKTHPTAKDANTTRDIKIVAMVDEKDQDGCPLSFEERRARKYGNFSSPQPTRTREPENQENVPLAPTQPSTKVKSCPSPTINTKAALADVFEMFNKPLQSEAVAPVGGPSEADLYVEDDETISAQVYKRTHASIGVFVDQVEEPRETSTQKQEDDNPFLEDRSGMTRSRGIRPKGSNVDEVKHGRDDSRTGPLSEEPCQSILPPSDLRGSRLGMPSAHSTPYHGRYTDENQPTTGDTHDTQPTHPDRPYRFSMRGLDLMTPITEVSHECDRTLLSTIGRTGDDGHTVMTLATFGDRTLSSISYDSQHTDHDDVPSDFAGQPIVLSRQDVGIGRSVPKNHDIDTLVEDLSGVRIASSDDEHVLSDTLPSVTIPLQVPNPCDPFDPSITALIAAHLRTQTWPRLHIHATPTPLAHLETSKTEPDLSEIGPYTLVSKLGQGGFGRVYLIEHDTDPLSDQEDDARLYALKHHFVPTPWEYLSLLTLHTRIDPTLRSSIIHPHSCHVFPNASFMVLDYFNGTLLDVVNCAPVYGYGTKGLDEILAAFFGVRVLRLVLGIHSAGFIHRDIKMDNFLVRLDESPEWDAIYGGPGWDAKGIVLVDWGTSVDTQLFQPHQRFKCDLDSLDPSFEAPSLNRDWKFDVDWYGVAGVLHVLLFGQYMQVTTTSDSIQLREPIKRYWCPIWNRLFHSLLNSGEDCAGEVQECWDALEAYLVKNSKSRNLRGLVKRVGTALAERKI
ncbi:BUB protein kinase [Spizellomyces punctatus DAOM BR117]|uniref:BUB protein kinase n=1 Tax=Spizellomyces punctatus (strain DAOM BR117) TaxID=645134 RepID=A0A0L0H9M4_SPIPD|nr:BUB protein kinase [Spizellomyces punctatus DAOM BR117]KNC97599.1 BUB protein kinase [Spizellomyces punctatus DAOM BR117]|eukprot:XP_016605639.1 BUB protein kinase [Spizellomyces punctatus DAOM BR117]